MPRIPQLDNPAIYLRDLEQLEATTLREICPADSPSDTQSRTPQSDVPLPSWNTRPIVRLVSDGPADPWSGCRRTYYFVYSTTWFAAFFVGPLREHEALQAGGYEPPATARIYTFPVLMQEAPLSQRERFMHDTVCRHAYQPGDWGPPLPRSAWPAGIVDSFIHGVRYVVSFDYAGRYRPERALGRTVAEFARDTLGYSNDPQAWTDLANARKRVGGAVRALLYNHRNCGRSSTLSAAHELRDALEAAADGGRTPVNLTRLAESFSRAGVDSDLWPMQATCGHVELTGDAIDVRRRNRTRGYDTACQQCREDGEVVWCVDDDELHWASDVFYWESDGDYHLEEESSGDYDEDEDEEDPNYILPYDADVMRFLIKDPRFDTTTSGDFHLGVELETVSTQNRDADVSRILAAFEDYAVCKRDGSLGDRGIEIVTRPTSLKEHLAKLSNWTPPPHLRAWNAGCCGMHVHIDSGAFTSLTLGKFIQFFNSPDNVDFIRQLAGRHPLFDSQAQAYAACDVSAADVVDPIKSLKGKSSNRYVMVNTTNLSRKESGRLGLDTYGGGANTIEVRIFRASLRKERMLAQLEFVHALLLYCRTASYKRMHGKGFLEWLRTSAGHYRNLARWYGINNKHGHSKHEPPQVLEAEPATA